MLVAISQRRCPVSVDASVVNTVAIVLLLRLQLLMVVPVGVVVQAVDVLLLLLLLQLMVMLMLMIVMVVMLGQLLLLLLQLMNVSVASDASLLWMVVMSVGDVVVVFVLLEELGTNRSDRVLVLFGVIASPKDLLLLDAIS